MTPIETVTSRLLHARRSGVTVSALDLPDAAAAYAVQAAVARELGWFDGRTPMHWKSGGPSREAIPTHAPLPPAGVWASPADARRWPFHLRGIEAEIALRLREPVDARLANTLDVASASDLVDAMCVSIEIVDSRWSEGLAVPALTKLADLQVHGALVLGEWSPWNRGGSHDWSAQVCRVRMGEQAPQVFQGTHSMGDPAWVLPAWLRHVTRDGAVAVAGTVVTTGTWCGLLQAQQGDAVEVVFDGIGQARIDL